MSVAGRVTFEPDGAEDLARRLAARYWDLTDPVRIADLDAMLAAGVLRFALHPEQTHRFTY